MLAGNHASYLDGIGLKAMLPPRFSFVIKREAASAPVLGLLLKRIGSEFVDRHDRGGRKRGARRVIKRAEQGHSLVFFPEGTFDGTPGLKRSHTGAFAAATRAEVPVVPAVIRGARRALLQLNYWIWFPERPRHAGWDILGGRLDGLLWRVTLAPDGAPLVYDAIHPCGCYHLFFPSVRAVPRPPPA